MDSVAVVQKDTLALPVKWRCHAGLCLVKMVVPVAIQLPVLMCVTVYQVNHINMMFFTYR